MADKAFRPPLPKWHERRNWRDILEYLYPPAVPGEEGLPPGAQQQVLYERQQSIAAQQQPQRVAPAGENKYNEAIAASYNNPLAGFLIQLPDPLSDALARLEKAEAALDASLKEMATKLMLLQTLLDVKLEPKP